MGGGGGGGGDGHPLNCTIPDRSSASTKNISRNQQRGARIGF